ncbi:hypothetical protein NQ315_007444 [Exocentrus adspersus]|uniref:C2H2-type domain-containing protein n=1 Tax=Exocentrus adspersus TaxID=1586481 RepID=A0AAV8VHC6_9CUCU|nr:hypothetical protein NQ315_007444 [Exocentrus adspersus]
MENYPEFNDYMIHHTNKFEYTSTGGGTTNYNLLVSNTVKLKDNCGFVKSEDSVTVETQNNDFNSTSGTIKAEKQEFVEGDGLEMFAGNVKIEGSTIDLEEDEVLPDIVKMEELQFITGNRKEDDFHILDWDSEQTTDLTARKVQKDPSRTQLFKCDTCDFVSKHRASLRYHALTHKDPSQINWFKCHLCDFKSKRSNSWKAHVLAHEDPSTVQWYECDNCTFRTKYRHNLRIHITCAHKDPSEIEYTKCDLCDFKTKFKYSLKKHKLKHESASEIKWYKCDSCDFKTKHEQSVKVHTLKHQNPTQVRWFHCHLCGFKAKQKGSLKTHINSLHKDPSEISWFRCDWCDFKTKRKDHLKSHVLVHKDTSEWLKCDLCDYKAKRKDLLKRHLSRFHENITK